MAQKILIDTDPGIDDAIALSIAMFDPEVEIVALTSVAGNASAATTCRNLRGLVEFFDPVRLPRIGVGEDPERAIPPLSEPLFGEDGLGGFVLPVAPLCNSTPAEKVICDAIRRYPHEVTVFTFGPLTNIARAFHRDPEIPTLIDRLIIAGGTYEAPGNILPLSEFNMYCDPVAAQYVFKSPCNKTVVPLDVTNRVWFSLEVLNELPGRHEKFGKFLRYVLKSAFLVYRKHYGKEQIHLQAPAAYFVLTRPGLFQSRYTAVEVETNGKLTRGTTVFERRNPAQWHSDVEVVLGVEAVVVRDLTLKKLDQTDLILSSREETHH